MTEKKCIGKYSILKCIGQGGEGSVYLARDEDLHRAVAIKQVGIREEGAKEENRILREADMLRQLGHPMLPVIYELLWEEAWYLVMEYIQGVTLQEYIGKNGYAGEKQARAWALQLLDILCYLHTRKPPVIYCDLKPHNIIVCPDGNLRLIDFGAAYRQKFGEKTERMAVTPGYGAPEQFGRAGKGVRADERSDIYAFGRVLYYMGTGADPARPPYTLLPVRNYQPLLGDGLERVIRRCIREEPSERYQIAEEVRKDLEKGDGRRRRSRRKSFIRTVEKRVWLTENAEG